MDAKEFNLNLKNLSASKDAFDRIYTFYFPKIVMYIARRYSDIIAEDVAQEFFVRLIKYDIDYYVQAPTSWVYKICDNLAKNYFAKRKKEQSAIGAAQAGNKGDVMTEFYGDYWSKLGTLSDTGREIVIMRVGEGYTLKEIAGILGIGYDNTRQIFSRAMRKLKKS